MIQFLHSVYSIITYKQKLEAWILVGLIFFMSIFEIIGLALILPFLFLVGNLDLVKTNPELHEIYLFFGFKTPLDFLYAVGVTAILFSFLGMVLSIYANVRLTHFANKLGAEFSLKVLKSFKDQAASDSKTFRKLVLSETAKVATHIILPAVTIVSKSLLLIVLVGVLFWINTPVTLFVFLTLAIVYGTIFKMTNAKVKINNRQIEKLKEEKGRHLLQLAKTNDDSTVFDRLKNFEKIAVYQGRLQAFNSVVAKLPRYLMMFLVFSSVVVVASYLKTVHGDQMTTIMHKMILYIVISLKTLPQIQNLFVNYLKLKSTLDSFYAIEGALKSQEDDK